MQCRWDQAILLVLLVLPSAAVIDKDADSEKRLKQLYSVLHNIALPEVVHSKKISKRLVLLLPGKVLSPDDYYPGDSYVKFKQNPSAGKFQEIPPAVMQRLFRLVDIIPGVDAMQGQESGERMSVYYEQVLGDMNIKRLKEIAKQKEILQQESVQYLLAAVPDPDNLKKQASRWDLYRRYEMVYNDGKQEMEETIDSNRNNKSSVAYQLWFQRNYPILQAKVDGAFIDWLVKGKKDQVELYRSRLDTSSPGTLLLEAKSALRASGTVSLDRTETVYPVEFTPDDWYKYLKSKDIELTADQITLKLGKLRAQKHILEAIESSSCDVSSVKAKADKDYADSSDGLEQQADKILALRCQCIQGNNQKACEEYADSLSHLSLNITAVGKKKLILDTIAAAQGSPQNIGPLKAEIDTEVSILQDDLARTGHHLPNLVSYATDAPVPEDNWLHFSYNSRYSHEVKTHDATQTSTVVKKTFSFGWIKVSHTKSTYEETEDNFSSFKSINVFVSGEILRVSVQMPWFRPELFRSSQLITPNYKVSPGPSSTDREFVQRVQDPALNYVIPHYVTGLLLARNVVLEFDGLAKTEQYKFVLKSTVSGIGLGWGFFSLNIGLHKNKGKAEFEASVSETGLKVKIPGVQLIGYYTEVTPEFPISN